MTPTPIPGPNTQFVERVGDTIDSAVQQGVVGVLLLLGVTAVLLALAFVFYQYRQRNAKPKESAETILGPMASLLDQSLSANREAAKAQKERDEEHRKELKERDDTHKKEIKEITERAVNAEVRSASAMEAMVGIQTNSNTDLSLLKTAVLQMVETGSLPLQAVAQTVGRIETKLDQEWVVKEADRKLKENILSELAAVNKLLVQIESKRRSTDELNKLQMEPKHEPVPT